jgi:hypothetical protein
MRYKWIPNCKIIDYENLKVKFVFDENGDFETDDPALIKWIKENKSFLKPIIGEKPPETKPDIKPLKLYKCSKCDFENTDKMKYITHTRTHKKEG